MSIQNASSIQKETSNNIERRKAQFDEEESRKFYTNKFSLSFRDVEDSIRLFDGSNNQSIEM